MLLVWAGCADESELGASRPAATDAAASYEFDSGAVPLHSVPNLNAEAGRFLMPADPAAGAVQTRLKEGDSPSQTASGPEHNTETYDHLVENAFLDAREQPLSTFSIDVDTASYANVRRFLNQHTLPPAGAVRIEELVNYFRYDYAPPTGEHPFAVHTEIATCPWQPKHRLVRIGLKGKEIAAAGRPRCNLVFLLDVSGSMDSADKLGLVKESMKLLVNQLGENDRIAIAVYAGSSGLVLPATPVDQRTRILDALDQLQAGGSTDGGSGIHLAYNVAVENFIDGGTNRVILCTDGDFNVGITSQSDLVNLIEEKAASGVYLSVLGFGMGNYKDSTMEKLADKGNGNYGYIDSLAEARKVLVEDMTGTLVTIAKDVKIQVEFNPANVNAYRLIGYENRMLAAQDFCDDTKDAGEIGAGHTVTALYEVVPVGVEIDVPQIGELKYQQPKELTGAAGLMELLTVALRYKTPDDSKVAEFNVPVRDEGAAFEASSNDFQFAAAVAAFGMLLRDSHHVGQSSFAAVQEWAAPAIAEAADEYRREFLTLVNSAATLKGTGRTAMR
jgi:Ca-activated chloride channel homolog